MRPGTALDRRMAELSDRQVPFVRATVVRARRPASAQPGDTALVLADGRIEGFVGGVCAEATVRVQALRLLRSGTTLLLRISPDAPGPGGGAVDVNGIDKVADAGVPDEGALVVANPCLSGGELEIFLEPLRPVPTVLVLGETPIARALLALGPGLDYELRGLAAQDVPDLPPEDVARAAAVVVASHGRDEEPLLAAAVRAEVPYIALVASRRRGAAVLDGMDLTDGQRAAIHTPAGLWIGARTPGEIAVSILAELVAFRHAVPVHGDPVGPGAPVDAEPAVPEAELWSDLEAVADPVCGMTVAVVQDTPFSDAAGHRHWFCSAGCRDRFAADPAHYAGVS